MLRFIQKGLDSRELIYILFERMYPYLELFGTKLYMTGIGIVAACIVFFDKCMDTFQEISSRVYEAF